MVEARGMMSGRALQANALWEREGGIPARLKYFMPSGDFAGEKTRALVGNNRLDRLEQRLRAAMKAGPPALVRLLHVGRPRGLQGLLVAMERVTPIRDAIVGGRLSAENVADLVEQLSYSQSMWMHYDICPGNTGMTRDGRFVFIDPDSYYEASEDGVHITLPAKKDRLPSQFWIRLAAEAKADGEVGCKLDLALARDKHDGEVLLLAAECCLGPLVQQLCSDYVDGWVADADCSDSVKRVLLGPLQAICRGESIDLVTVTDGMRKCALSAKSASGADVAMSTVSGSVKRGPNLATDRDSDPKKLGGVACGSAEWHGLAGARRDLRAERLRGHDLIDYKSAVLAAARASHDRSLWREAIVVLLGYEKNAIEAKGIIAEALEFFPADEEFLADQRMVNICVGVQ